MKELRDYQVQISENGSKILAHKKIVYLAMQVRTGKTTTSLNICKLNGYKNVLFLTKKKAVKSIQEDYNDFGFNEHFEITITNNESMHKVFGNFDCVIHDESHRFGSFPKPSQGAKLFKEKYSTLPLILLSGTPTPESYSQIFHQFWISRYSPFAHVNFYKWAHDYVNITQRNLGYGMVNDYTKADKALIESVIKDYMISYTQEESGFKSKVIERILYIEMSNKTHYIANELKKDLVLIGSEETILADTAVKLMSKLHQIYSGTVKFESGNSKILDDTKARFIYDNFSSNKIAIFYKFKAELDAIKSIFKDEITTDLEEFNSTNKSIALQFVSGREGISLKKAKYIVTYNIDFSATTYFQFKDRMTTIDRLENEVFWIFTRGGLEDKIYKSVLNKKNYTSSHFKKDINVKFPKKDNRRIQA